MKNLSIIIPTYNKFERLRLALYSYMGQTYPKENFEIVIVPNRRDEGIEELLKPFQEQLNLQIVPTDKFGIPIIRNLGAHSATGDYFGFFDDDVLLNPDYLSSCMTLMDNQMDAVVRSPVYTMYFLRFFKDPEKGIPYPQFEKDITPDSSLREYLINPEMILHQWDKIAKQCTKLNRFERLVEECLNFRDNRQIVPWMGLSGSGVILHRDCFWSVGGYDQEIGKLWGAESVDLGYRLWQSQKRFINNKTVYTAHIDHPRDEALTKFNDSFGYMYQKYNDPNILLITELIRGNENIKEALKRVV